MLSIILTVTCWTHIKGHCCDTRTCWMLSHFMKKQNKPRLITTWFSFAFPRGMPLKVKTCFHWTGFQGKVTSIRNKIVMLIWFIIEGWNSMLYICQFSYNVKNFFWFFMCHIKTTGIFTAPECRFFQECSTINYINIPFSPLTGHI